jgi:hypothetical protein
MSKTTQINVKINTKDAEQSSKNLANSVGAVGDRTQSLKAELRQMKEALLELDEGTAQFEELLYNASQLQDAIGDVNARVKVLASDTLALDQGIGVVQGLAGGFQAAQGAAALFGVKNEELLAVLTKLQATQAVINGLQQVANMLNKDSAAGILLRNTYTKVLNTLTVQQTAATGGATVATRALGVAMNALPILAIIGGVTALIAAFSSMGDEADKSREKLEKLNKTNLDAAKLQLFQLKEANSELEQELRKIDLAVLEGTKTEKEANEEKKKLLNERIDLLEEEVKTRRASVGAIIYSMEQTGQLEKVEGELYNDKVKRLRAYLELQDEEDASLKRKKVILDSYLLSVDSEIKTRETLANLTKNEGKTSEQNAKAAADAAKRRLELLFMIANQERINELERLKRQEDRLIKEEASEEEILTKKQEVNDKEKEIAIAKYDFLLKEAKGNAQKIKLLELQRIGELEKIESDYQINIEKFNEDRLKKEQERINKSKKAAADAALSEIQNEQEKQLQILTNRINEELKAANLTEKEREKILKRAQQEEKAIRASFSDELKRLQISQVETERDILLQNTKLTEEERRAIIADSELKITKIRENALDTSFETSKTKLQEWLDENAMYIQATMGTISGLVDTLNMAFDEIDARAKAQREQFYFEEEERFNSMLANRTISQEEYDQKMKELDQQKRTEELREKRKQFQRDKANNIVNAVMSTAQSVMQALGGMPPPASYVFAALNAALGAAQIGIISSQQFRAARGGIVPGMASKVDQVPSMLAPGEAVINSTSASMFPQLLSAINEAGGGVSLAPEIPMGGSASSSKVYDENKKQETVRAVVVESDVTDVQRRVRRIERANEF